ncbi:MAG: hypothetical protein ABEJ22_00510 [Haloferacaceae archaeon]
MAGTCEFAVRVGETTRGGPAVDVVADVSPDEMLAAVRGRDVESDLRVECPSPGPVHDALGVVAPDPDFSLRGALAAVARSRGLTAPQRPALESARERLADRSVPETDLASARRRVADAGDSVDRLRERVAALRGRVQAVREVGGDVDAAEADLESAIERLSEVETERIAAVQALDAAEERARNARDRREERFALEDRIANLEREARAALAAEVYDEFTAAVATLPGDGSPGDAPGDYEGDPVTAMLGVVRIADFDAPVVLAAGRFSDARHAAATLDAPVVRL